MNILYIIGNGFDRAQGMATSYPEFYKYLLENKEGSPLLQKMKIEIKNDLDAEKNLWSDMEWGLGKFSSNIKTEKEMDEFHEELSQHLQNYLYKIDSEHILYSKLMLARISEDILQPEKYFVEADKEAYKSYLESFQFDSICYNAITLNYTNTLEKMLENHPCLFDKNSKEIPFNICHLHGELKDTIILGVSNKEQIANTNFRQSEFVTSFLVKSNANDAMKNLRNKKCEQLIKEANVIIIFGVSYGDTDSHLWKSIGHEITNRENICVVNFILNSNVQPTRKFNLSAIEKIEREKIYSKMGINQTEEIDHRFFIEINTKLFQNILNNKSYMDNQILIH